MLPRKNGTYYAKESWLPGSAVAELGSLSFSGDMPKPQQRAEVRAWVAAWLATKTETMDGAKILLDNSYDPQTLDEGREIEYSKEEVFLEDGAARVAAVFNRPLRTPNPFVWGDMYKAEAGRLRNLLQRGLAPGVPHSRRPRLLLRGLRSAQGYRQTPREYSARRAAREAQDEGARQRRGVHRGLGAPPRV
jgi:hypothetical protein